MISSTNKKPLLRVLAGETVTPPPFWFMRQAGRYLPEYRKIRDKAGNFLNLCYNPVSACEVTLQPLRRYAMDGAILFSDILVIPHALGRCLTFEQGKGPCLNPMNGMDDVETLALSNVQSHLSPIFKTIDLVKKSLPAHTALIGFCGAPWTVATYMIEGGCSKDYVTTKRWAYGQPDVFQALIDRLVTASTAYLIAQINAGVDAVQIFDSWAGVLPADEFQRWVIAPTASIVERLKSVHPTVPIIGFPRGAGLLYEDFARSVGCDAVSLDTTVSLDWAAKTLQPLIAVQGNLDPVYLMTSGKKMNNAVDKILDTLGRGPFIFNLGHGVNPTTPPDNVARLADRIRSFR